MPQRPAQIPPLSSELSSDESPRLENRAEGQRLHRNADQNACTASAACFCRRPARKMKQIGSKDERQAHSAKDPQFEVQGQRARWEIEWRAFPKLLNHKT